MILHKIRNKATGQITNQWFDRPDCGADYYADCFGKPDRWVLEGEEDISEAIETRVNANGKTEYYLEAEFEREVEDLTTQIERERVNSEALAYLASTDWYIIRELDTGEICPDDIRAERVKARARIKR